MFDMKKDKWFIRTPTPEISEAVQLWLFEQGFKIRTALILSMIRVKKSS